MLTGPSVQSPAPDTRRRARELVRYAWQSWRQSPCVSIASSTTGAESRDHALLAERLVPVCSDQHTVYHRTRVLVRCHVGTGRDALGDVIRVHRQISFPSSLR